jgi:hypothetical protein
MPAGQSEAEMGIDVTRAVKYFLMMDFIKGFGWG